MTRHHNPQAMPLPLLTPGETARVSHINARGNGMVRRLNAMGISQGVELSVLSSQGGPLLVCIGNGRVALGRGMAQRVMVVPDRK